MRWRQPNWTRILTILLVILASFAILYIAGTFFLRFTQAIFLFVLGAITAYVLSPLVNRLEQACRYRWVAILLAYASIAALLFALGLLLVTPFIQQAQSLADNLHNPSPSSLGTIKAVEASSNQTRRDLHCLHSSPPDYCFNSQPPVGLAQIDSDLTTLQRNMTGLQNGTLAAHTNARGAYRKQLPGKGVPPNPVPQTRVPISYVRTIQTPLTRLLGQYRSVRALDQKATSGEVNVSSRQRKHLDKLVNATIASAKRVSVAAQFEYHTTSTTPILLIRSQSWLDDHDLHIDLPNKLGQASKQLSDQGTNILDNAITIISETVNILLNTTLILIISFYLLHDGRGILRRGLAAVPNEFHDQVWFFVHSVDRVMGGYVRGTIFLSLLAGLLGGGGAAVLGVPYPLLIGIMTFLLQTVPVIGPIVAVIPAVVISLFFVPIVTTIELLVWFLIFQQIVTNIIGPRVLGIAVGIHPLEALLAVLVGYPLGGFLGAFLAVPVMGVVHILIREAYFYFVLGRDAPTASVPAQITEPEAVPTTTALTPTAKPDSAG